MCPTSDSLPWQPLSRCPAATGARQRQTEVRPRAECPSLAVRAGCQRASQMGPWPVIWMEVPGVGGYHGRCAVGQVTVTELVPGGQRQGGPCKLRALDSE